MVERIKIARLIYNPTSGQEIIKKNSAEVLDVLETWAMKPTNIKRLQNIFTQNEAERARNRLLI